MDIAILFSTYETDILERFSRPQLLEATIEQELKLYNQISIVDLENVPMYLQFSIMKNLVQKILTIEKSEIYLLFNE